MFFKEHVSVVLGTDSSLPFSIGKLQFNYAWHSWARVKEIGAFIYYSVSHDDCRPPICLPDSEK